MFCNDLCIGNPTLALDGVCDDGGPGSLYAICAEGTDCTDCGRRFTFPPSPPPLPPSFPPVPPPRPPPPLQLTSTDEEEELNDDDDGEESFTFDGLGEPSESISEGADVRRAYQPLPSVPRGGQYFGGSTEGLLPSSSEPVRILDWQHAPISAAVVSCRHGRKLDGAVCQQLSPQLGASLSEDAQRAPEEPSFSGVSYSSTYMSDKAADTPNLPWYGYSYDDEHYGIWMKGPSSIVGHAGFLISIHEGPENRSGPFGSCLLMMSYLRPSAKLWRLSSPPFGECCRGAELNRTCLPSWLRIAVANHSTLFAPGVLHSSNGTLPSASGARTQHFVVYYSTAPATVANGLACIGRISGRWMMPDPTCEPRLEWEDDGQPVLCSNSAASKEEGNEQLADVFAGPKFNSTAEWRASSNGEALAYGAEPFYGLDGSLYLVYGAYEPGNIQIVQLNESSGRLPKVAQPGRAAANTSNPAYHHVASGPSFQLGPDHHATSSSKDAYLDGEVRPRPNKSLVQNAFVLPRQKNGSTEYFLFVEWFDDGAVDTIHNDSVGRIYVGRSLRSPTGPFYDRIGNEMGSRSHVVLGGARTISILSARWGANCDGVGYDVKAVAELKCEGVTRCNWLLRYDELDAIDPSAYSDFEFPDNMQTVADQYTGTPNNFAASPGCRRDLTVTFSCTKHATVLYEEERLSTYNTTKVEFVGAEAANGSVAQLTCETPQSVLLPGGTLFADAQRLGGNLHFSSLGHSGVFSYAVNQGVRYVFTFQYRTRRSTMSEYGARRIRFAKDGWPVLAADKGADWATCAVPEATYSMQAPNSYWAPEAQYSNTASQAHYGGSSTSRTHCTHHSERGTHCVGDSLRATHPQLGVAGPEGSMLHGRIDEVGTSAYWREQEDHCKPRAIGRTLACTRFAGSGDLDATHHVSTMERIRGCPQLECQRTFQCRPDPLTRAAAGTIDTCTDGLECKKLPHLGVAAWDSDDFFRGGVPLEITRDGRRLSPVRVMSACRASAYVSRIDPALGVVTGGTMVTIYGTGFGHPARCRFGWIETAAVNVTAHLMYCKAPAVDVAFDTPSYEGVRTFPVQRLMQYPVFLEVSMMSRAVLSRTPLMHAVRDGRGENFTIDRKAFQFYDANSISISFIQPLGGPAAGMTLINIHGQGFFPQDSNSNVKCKFASGGHENLIIQASYHNSERISCFTPRHTLRSSGFEAVSITITFDEQQYITGTQGNFSFYSLQNTSAHQEALDAHTPPTVAISAMHPTGGPARGGTTVTLYGRGFAALDSPGRLIPPFRNQPGSAGSLDPYRSVISRSGLFCMFGDVGAVVHGAAEAHQPQIYHTLIPASASAEHMMVCQTPEYADFSDLIGTGANASVPVEITLNGNKHERTQSGLSFMYYREDRYFLPKLHGMQPQGGPSDRSTFLTIYGSHLQSLTGHGSPMCRFGSGLENSTVPATILPSAEGQHATVLCVAPPLQSSLARKDVALNVAQNGQDYLRRPLRFHYYPLDKLVISKLQPMGGPSDGGTRLLLSGRQLGVSRGGLRCQFGEVWTVATMEDEDSIQCLSPPRILPANATYVEEEVRVTVNNDTASRSPSFQLFTYFASDRALSIKSIYPRAGLTVGGTVVTLSGRNFRDLGGIFCIFGVSLPVVAEAVPPPPPPWPLPGRSGDLRLANGRAPYEGRVEIYHDGEWGTICDDMWDLNDAHTVCRQLGFAGALNATCCGSYGPGTGRIWLDNVNCHASANQLDHCASLGWGVHDCDHHEDAGVICMPLSSSSATLPPPALPPPPGLPWERLDSFQLTRGPAAATLKGSSANKLTSLRSFNSSAELDTITCRSPPSSEALGTGKLRELTKAVEIIISINGDTFGIGLGQNFTYYAA